MGLGLGLGSYLPRGERTHGASSLSGNCTWFGVRDRGRNRVGVGAGVSVSVSARPRSGLGLQPGLGLRLGLGCGKKGERDRAMDRLRLPEDSATHEVHRLDETCVRADVDSDAPAAARGSAAAEYLVRG